MTPICGKCGVRYEDNCDGCPLCRQRKAEPPEEKPKGAKTLKHFREAVTFSAFSTGLIVLITDFAYGGSLGWSRIPLLSLGFIWLTLFLLSFLRGKRYLLVPAAAITTGVFLYFLSGFTSDSTGWFSEIVLPVLFFTAFISILVTTVVMIFRLSFLGTVSTGLAGAGLLMICIDFTVNPGISWSLVAASGVVPVIVFLAGLEKRLEKKGSSLEKYFNA